MVNLFPREVPRVHNLFPRELIESPPKEFPKANPRPHQRPDPRPKTRGAAGPKGFWTWVWHTAISAQDNANELVITCPVYVPKFTVPK